MAIYQPCGWAFKTKMVLHTVLKTRPHRSLFYLRRMNQKIENWLIGAIVAAFCLYIMLRAWLLPMTVDESATAINHVPRLVFDTLTYQKEANPNNHILNTILIKIFTGIFGWHHFVVRLPVLLGGFLYAWASVKLVRKLSDQTWVRVFTLVMLFGNLFLLEFFSLARGYGLAIGLMTCAMWYAWRFLESNERKAMRWSFLFAGLAVYANFTLLIFFAPFVVLLLLISWQLNPSFSQFWQQSKPSLTMLGVFLLLWVTPLKRLSKDSELVHWDAQGTYFDAMKQSVRAATHANPYLGDETALTFTWLLMLGVLAIAVIAFWRWWKQGFRFSRDPHIFLVFMLLGAAVTNIAQVYFTQTPFLQSRLALFYWPLFALTLGAAAVWVSGRFGAKKVWIFMAPLLALTFINTVRTANLRYSYEWISDSDTFTILEYLKKAHEAEGRKEPFLLDADWFMQNSFVFHLDKDRSGYVKYVKLVPYHGRQAPKLDSDFYYAINFDTVKDVIDAYEIVLRVPNSSMLLLRKK